MTETASTTKVLNIKVEYTQAMKRLAELEKQMVTLKDNLADLNSAETKDDAWSKQMARNKQAMKDVTEESNRLTKQIQSQIKEEHNGIKSILEMTQNLDILIKKYKGLSEAERQGATGSNLLTQISTLSKEIKTATAPLDAITKKFKDMGDSITGQKNRLAELVKTYENYSASQRKIHGETTLDEIRKLTESIKTQERVLNNSKKGYANVAGSVNDLRDRLRNLISTFDNLSEKERNGNAGAKLKKEIGNLRKEIEKAEQSTGRFQRNVGNYMNSIMKGFTRFFVQMGLGFTTIGQLFVGLGNAFKDGVNTVIEFNREMSKLTAILQGTRESVKELEAQARALGATTRYTATEVVQLQTELAKLGYQKGQIINMTESVLHLAQATGSNLADAASLAGAALRIFGDSSTMTAMYVDQMTTATAKSALNFDYIKTALPIVGGAAEMFGFKLQDVLTLLGQLANSGMEASMAATATRNIFLKLADSNGVLAKQLGKPIKNMNDLLNGLRELKDRGADLNDALEMTNVRSAVAFTRFLKSTDSARQLSNQLNWTGKSIDEIRIAADRAGMSLEEYRQKMDDCSGTAKEMADEMENNLGGDLKMLASRWDEWMIAMQNGQGTMRSVIQWLTTLIEKLGIVSRAIDISVDMQANKDLQELSQWWLPRYEDKDLKELESIRQKMYDDMIKQGKSASDALKEAEIEAQAAVIKNIEEIKKSYENAYETALQRRQEYDEKAWEYSNGSYKHGLFSKNLEELQAIVDTEKDSLTITKADWRIINERIRLLKQEAELKAMMLMQDSRLEQFRNRPDEAPEGIGIEDDNARRKRLEREKSAAKALLDAKKAYNKAVLDQTRNYDDALLLDYESTAENLLKKFESNLEDAIEKQKAVIRNQYLMEIETLQYKIDEELKMRGDESEKERIQKEAAIEVYKKTIEEKTNDYYKAISRLEWENIKASAERIKKEYDLRLHGIISGSNAELKVRIEALDEERRIEIANLELQASKDAAIANMKEQLLTDIAAKYEKKRTDIRRQEMQNQMKLLQTDFEIAILNETEDEFRRAQLEVQKDQAILNGIIREREVMVEQLDIAEKDSDKALQRLDEARKFGTAKEIEDAQKVADEKNAIYQQMLDNYLMTDKEYELKRAQQEEAIRRAILEQNNIETEQKNRAFENNVLFQDNELDRLRAELQLANALRANMRREDYENDKQFIQAKLQAEREYFDAQKALYDKQFEMRAATVSSLANLFGTLSDAMADNMEENKANVRLQKILSLAQVYLAQGVAIANAIRVASESSITPIDLAAQIAVSIAQVVSSTVAAISSIKKAKFAKGAVNIQGPGTGTSDSIPAMISRGESVMTAKATQMFGGLLAIMNEIAAQPHFTPPTMLQNYNPAQANANTEGQTEAFRAALIDLHPVVSVTEIDKVGTRVKAIENLDTL